MNHAIGNGLLALLFSFALCGCEKEQKAGESSKQTRPTSRTSQKTKVGQRDWLKLSAEATVSPEGLARLSRALSDCSIDELLTMLSEQSAGRNPVMLAELLAALAEKDPQLALTRLAGMDSKFSSSMAAYPVFRAVAKNSPDVLGKWMLTLDGKSLDLLGCHAVEALAAYAPGEGVAVCAARPDRKDLFSTLMFQMGTRGIDKAKEIILKLPPEKQENAFVAAANGLALSDPVAALTLMVDSSKLDNTYAITSIQNAIYESCREDPGRAIVKLKELDPVALQKALDSQKVVSVLGTNSPEGMIDLLSKIVCTKENELLFSRCVDAIACKSPQLALGWLGGFQEGDAKQSLIRGAMTSWSRSDPNGFASSINQFDSSSKAAALDALANAWGSANPIDALQWEGGLTKSERDSYVKDVLLASAQANPTQTIEILNGGAFGGMEGVMAEVEEVIGGSLARRDPQQAIKWVSQLTGESQVSAVANVAGTIAGKDPEMVATWLTTMNAGPARNAGVEALARAIERSDPGAAKQWRSSISR